MNKKIIILAVVFLLLVPFRLPIGVLFIGLVTSIANSAGELTDKILVANVIVTKLIYDIVLGLISLFNLEMLIRSIKGRKPRSECNSYNRDEFKEEDLYFQTVFAAFFMLSYIIFDCINTYDLYYILNK